ncbi:hypothetical protein [Escherichia coli]
MRAEGVRGAGGVVVASRLLKNKTPDC